MPPKTETLPVHERFYSFQGEGQHMGRAAFFIRLFGCPVHCPWCDSAGTWHPDYIPEKIQRFTAEALAEEASATKAEFVVITGGEPTIHDLRQLTRALQDKGLEIHLETSGAFPIQGEFDWVTVSPKRWKLPLPENLAKANEFKVIVDAPEAIEEYVKLLPAPNRPIWLHPEWSQRDNPTIREAITNWIKQHGAPFRAGAQLHKQYSADLSDHRSAPAAPLGGDETKGY